MAGWEIALIAVGSVIVVVALVGGVLFAKVVT